MGLNDLLGIGKRRVTIGASKTWSVGGEQVGAFKVQRPISKQKVFGVLQSAKVKGLISGVKLLSKGLGAWEGTLEPSYTFGFKSGQKGMEYVRKGLKEQQALYFEDGGFGLYSKEEENKKTVFRVHKAKYKLVLKVQTRNKSWEWQQYFLNQLTASTPRQLFMGASLRETDYGFYVESGLFFSGEEGIKASMITDIQRRFAHVGMKVKVYMVRAR